jgi:uncharacterized protein
VESAIYRGRVRHRRFHPRAHAFAYTIFQLYLDLAELDTVFRGRWLWSVNRANIASFHEQDYLPGEPGSTLDSRARNLVETRTGQRPGGPIRLLTHPRYFGFVFNPVSFYYCFDAPGTAIETIIAEVHNTPWDERHCYVLDARAARDDHGSFHFRVEKAFHVSPFLAMDYHYHWRMTPPGEALSVYMRNEREGRADFDAALSLRRVPLSGPHLASALARHPFITGKIITAIYWQALRLWWKGTPVQPHPVQGDPGTDPHGGNGKPGSMR